MLPPTTSASTSTTRPPMIQRFFDEAPSSAAIGSMASSGEGGGETDLAEHVEGPHADDHRDGAVARHLGGDAVADDQQHEAPDGEHVDAREQTHQPAMGAGGSEGSEVRGQERAGLDLVVAQG